MSEGERRGPKETRRGFNAVKLRREQKRINAVELRREDKRIQCDQVETRRQEDSLRSSSGGERGDAPKRTKQERDETDLFVDSIIKSAWARSDAKQVPVTAGTAI